jgi:hypothetical protein
MKFLQPFVIAFKIFKTLCYTKVFLEQLMLINPFAWPNVVLWDITEPYFGFIGWLFPVVIGRKIGLNLNVIIAIEFLNFFVKLLDGLAKS